MGSESRRRLRLAVLGPMRAWRDGGQLALGPVRQQAVLAALALRPGLLVSREQLLDGVWGESPPQSGRKVLPSYVYGLRRTLDESGTAPGDSLIRGERGGYRLVVDGVRLDVAELAERVDEAQRAKASGDPATAAERLSAALALFDGEPLAGLPGPYADAERQRLLARLRTVRLERLECLVLTGRFADALDELAALSAADPADESLVALRMRALYGSERQAEALGVYQDMCERLREELGVDPGDELRRVHEAVLRRDDGRLLGPAVAHTTDVPDAARQLSLPRRTVNDLPGDSGRLVGRDRELAQLIAPAAPGSVSVVTVDGTAGVGKTALVVRAARELSGHHPDGCLFMDLHAHSAQRRQAPERALQRLLRSLGAASGELPGDLEELTAAWRAATSPLRLLLVLDDALDADQVRPLLPAGAGSRVLVAGRRRLAELDADCRVTLEPLESGDAVSLLTHLIGAERASGEPEATRQLVGLCDGLPLALRIAGSRLQNRRSWTVEYLVGRMAGDEHRLGELSVGNRSVEAAFRLSYDQLMPEQQRGFRALGVAPTVEFDVLTVAAVLDAPPRDTERVLESLVDTSLLQEPRPGRYRLHDLVRVHARRVTRRRPTRPSRRAGPPTGSSSTRAGSPATGAAPVSPPDRGPPARRSAPGRTRRPGSTRPAGSCPTSSRMPRPTARPTSPAGSRRRCATTSCGRAATRRAGRRWRSRSRGWTRPAIRACPRPCETAWGTSVSTSAGTHRPAPASQRRWRSAGASPTRTRRLVPSPGWGLST